MAEQQDTKYVARPASVLVPYFPSTPLVSTTQLVQIITFLKEN